MTSVAAIVQARLSSERFPRKVLKPLCNMPILWHVLERVKRCKNVDVIAVAIPDSHEDDYLARLVTSWGFKVVRGSKNDVLARYVQASKQIGADYVVRVTSDAPLICPNTIDALIEVAKENNADYATGHAPSAHEGFEVISTNLLLWLDENISDPHQREHVTLFVRENLEQFDVAYLKLSEKHLRKDLHLSIDNLSDLEFFEAIYRELWQHGKIVDFDQALEFIDSHPEVRALNSHVRQKSTSLKALKFAFRVDAGETIGLGHLYRSYALARWLNEAQHAPVTFLVKGKPALFSMLHEKGYRTVQLPASCNDSREASEIAKFVKSTDIDTLIIDVKHPYPACALKILKRHGIKTIAFDPSLETAELFDLAIFPDASALFDIPSHLKFLRGPKYFPLRTELKRNLYRKSKGEDPSKLLIFAGGGDERNLTSLFLDAIAKLKRDLKIYLLIGQANTKKDAILSRLKNYPHTLHVFSGISNPASIFSQVDCALVTYGTIVYELAYFGVPTLTVSHSPKNAASESLSTKLGFFKPLGYWENLQTTDIRAAVENLFSDMQLAFLLSQRAQSVVDGMGAERIANAIKAIEGIVDEKNNFAEVVSLPTV